MFGAWVRHLAVLDGAEYDMGWEQAGLDGEVTFAAPAELAGVDARPELFGARTIVVAPGHETLDDQGTAHAARGDVMVRGLERTRTLSGRILDERGAARVGIVTNLQWERPPHPDGRRSLRAGTGAEWGPRRASKSETTPDGTFVRSYPSGYEPVSVTIVGSSLGRMELDTSFAELDVKPNLDVGDVVLPLDDVDGEASPAGSAQWVEGRVVTEDGVCVPGLSGPSGRSDAEGVSRMSPSRELTSLSLGTHELAAQRLPGSARVYAVPGGFLVVRVRNAEGLAVPGARVRVERLGRTVEGDPVEIGSETWTAVGLDAACTLPLPVAARLRLTAFAGAEVLGERELDLADTPSVQLVELRPAD